MSETFDSFGTSRTSLLSSVVFLLGQVIPGLTRLPTTRNLLMDKLHSTTSKIADQLLEETRKEREGGKSEDKSIIGLLRMFRTFCPTSIVKCLIIGQSRRNLPRQIFTCPKKKLWLRFDFVILSLTRTNGPLRTDECPHIGWI